jgi:hypothetical protein
MMVVGSTAAEGVVMSSSLVSRRTAVAGLVIAAALASPAGAFAAADGSATTIAVTPRVLSAAPERSPVDFPGVAQARAGEPLPAGYVVVARDVRISRGAEGAYAALRMACPKGKTWRTGAAAGDIGMSVLDRAVSEKRSVLVLAGFDTHQTALGETAAGTIYALCR